MRCVLVASAVLATCASAHSAPGDPAPTQTAPAVTSVARSAPPSAPAPVIVVGDRAATGRVVAVRIAAAVGDAAATDRPAYARAGDKVTLYAVIDVRAG